MSLIIASASRRRIANPTLDPGIGAWTPADLFTGGEAGFWFDFSDMSTLWQDAAGTVPVTAVSQRIGRINDKSGNGNDVEQASASAQPLYTESSGLGRSYWDGNDVMSMDTSATTMSFLHKDGGVFFGASVAPYGANPNALYGILGNNAVNSTKIGVCLLYDDRSASAYNDALRAQVTRGVSSSYVYDFTSANNVFPAVTKSTAFINIPSAGPLESYIDNASTGTTTKANTESTADASYWFDIGAAGFGASRFLGEIYQAVAINRELTPTELATLQTYLTS